MIVTIDGPAGTGKSTVARKVSEEMGFLHMDTGALYRSAAYAVLKNSISAHDQKSVEKFVEEHPLTVEFHQGVPSYCIAGLNATPHIRTSEVSQAASQIAVYPGVRQALIAVQRQMAQGINVVCEGRDMGTVVFPHADHKFFLTARPEIRAQRRYNELLNKGLVQEGVSEESVLKELQMRDHTDSTREINPLKIPEKAHVIDTSDLTIDDVVGTILSIIE